MTRRSLPALTLMAFALLAGCGDPAALDQAFYNLGLRDEPPAPPEPEPLPAAVVAALPPGAPQSTVILNGDGCYLFSIEVTDPPSGYPVRDAAGNPICEGDAPSGPVALADTSAPPETPDVVQ